MNDAMGFDRVVIDVDGDVREMSVDEFMTMPLRAKVSHLLRGQFAFFDGDAPVTSRDAFERIRRASACG